MSATPIVWRRSDWTFPALGVLNRSRSSPSNSFRAWTSPGYPGQGDRGMQPAQRFANELLDVRFPGGVHISDNSSVERMGGEMLLTPGTPLKLEL